MRNSDGVGGRTSERLRRWNLNYLARGRVNIPNGISSFGKPKGFAQILKKTPFYGQRTRNRCASCDSFSVFVSHECKGAVRRIKEKLYDGISFSWYIPVINHSLGTSLHQQVRLGRNAECLLSRHVVSFSKVQNLFAS